MNQHHESKASGFSAGLRSVLRTVFGVYPSVEVAEARREAEDAIELMGQSAEDLKVVVSEFKNTNTCRVTDMDGVFKAIVKDMGND